MSREGRERRMWGVTLYWVGCCGKLYMPAPTLKDIREAHRYSPLVWVTT